MAHSFNIPLKLIAATLGIPLILLVEALLTGNADAGIQNEVSSLEVTSVAATRIWSSTEVPAVKGVSILIGTTVSASAIGCTELAPSEKAVMEVVVAVDTGYNPSAGVSVLDLVNGAAAKGLAAVELAGR